MLQMFPRNDTQRSPSDFIAIWFLYYDALARFTQPIQDELDDGVAEREALRRGLLTGLAPLSRIGGKAGY